MPTNFNKRVCIGAFAGAHGVKGVAKVKTFTETPENIAAYGPVSTEDATRSFTLSFIRTIASDLALVSAPEIESREDAESLKGVRLYIERAQLPTPAEDEFYFEDLIGLDVFDGDGAPAGKVKAVFDFGAGELLELEKIPGRKGTLVIPFTKTLVPNIDIAAGRITILLSDADLDESDAKTPTH